MNKRLLTPVFIIAAVMLTAVILTACTAGADEMVRLTVQAYSEPTAAATIDPPMPTPINQSGKDELPTQTPTPTAEPPYPAPPTLIPMTYP